MRKLLPVLDGSSSIVRWVQNPNCAFGLQKDAMFAESCSRQSWGHLFGRLDCSPMRAPQPVAQALQAQRRKAPFKAGLPTSYVATVLWWAVSGPFSQLAAFSAARALKHNARLVILSISTLHARSVCRSLSDEHSANLRFSPGSDLVDVVHADPPSRPRAQRTSPEERGGKTKFRPDDEVSRSGIRDQFEFRASTG